MATTRPPLALPRGPADSPCVRNCCLDESDVCLGCGRTLDEILRWREATDEQRAGMLADARERMALRQRRQDLRQRG